MDAITPNIAYANNANPKPEVNNFSSRAEKLGQYRK